MATTLLHSVRALPAVCVVAALFGCAASTTALAPESGLTALSINRLAAATLQHYVARPVHPDLGATWLATKKPGSHVYFVSDWATDDVYVYKYPQGSLVAKLTAFQLPYGQCADANGNVWITNFGGSSIVEYAHAPSVPIAKLHTDGNPIGCAVSATGELAVANYSTASGAGDIEVFQNESGTPTAYSSTTCYNVWPPGYDLKGNLYVEGTGSSGNAVCELASTGGSLVPVTFDQTIVKPGSVMWDGKYITLTDQDYGSTQATAVYRAREDTSGNLKLEGTLVLTDTCNNTYADVPQPFLASARNTPKTKIQAFVVLGGNLDCAGVFDYWAYPTPSGNPIVSFDNAPAQPYGQAYSTTNKVKN